MTEDHDLMTAYVAGNADAFEALYRRYERRVYGFFVRALGDRGTAEDLLQQTFLKLHRARGSYQRGLAVGGWIFRIAYNLYRDELRRRMRHPVDVVELEDEAASDDVSDAAIRREQGRQVRAAIAELPETQRDALLLCKYMGLSYDEAAQVTGVEADVLKLRVFRGLRALRGRFQEEAEPIGRSDASATNDVNASHRDGKSDRDR